MSDDKISNKDLEQVITRYQERINEVGVSFESLASGSIEKQRLRCKVHASALTGDASSVLDIGCGIAYFYTYLEETRDREIKYTGYDIVPEYIDFCKATYPQADFKLHNFLNDGIDGNYDTIVLSQVLNNRYSDSENMAVMERALRLAYEHATVSVSIDMMSSYVDYENPVLFYYSPEEILTIAKSISQRVVIRHDYRRFEFCVQLFKDDAADFIP